MPMIFKQKKTLTTLCEWFACLVLLFIILARAAKGVYKQRAPNPTTDMKIQKHTIAFDQLELLISSPGLPVSLYPSPDYLPPDWQH